jgi:cytochrome d ubiquinol oxidase subunit I
MGLALLTVILMTLALKTGNPNIIFLLDSGLESSPLTSCWESSPVIPMEFQFGTNWSEFSRRTGGVIGMPLAMEGIFSFFLESAFLRLFLFGEKRLSRWGHWGAAFLVVLGSWISGFFIIVADAWMQHPVAYRLLPNGVYEVSSFWGLLMNPWAWLQYAQYVRRGRHWCVLHALIAFLSSCLYRF